MRLTDLGGNTGSSFFGLCRGSTTFALMGHKYYIGRKVRGPSALLKGASLDGNGVRSKDSLI